MTERTLSRELHALADAPPTSPDWAMLAIAGAGRLRRRRAVAATAGVLVAATAVVAGLVLVGSAGHRSAVPAANLDPRIFSMREVLSAAPTTDLARCPRPLEPALDAPVVACDRPGANNFRYELGPAEVSRADVSAATVKEELTCVDAPTCRTPSRSRYVVDLTFTDDALLRLTTKTAGGTTPIAMLVDGYVVSAPVNQQPIDGPTELSTFTHSEATLIAGIINGTVAPGPPLLGSISSTPSPLVEIGSGRMDGAHFTVRGSRDGSALKLIVDPGDESGGTSAPLLNGELSDGTVAEVSGTGQDAAPQPGMVAVFPHAETELYGRQDPSVRAIRVVFTDGTSSDAIVLPAPTGWGFGAWVALVPGWHHVADLVVTRGDGTHVTLPQH